MRYFVLRLVVFFNNYIFCVRWWDILVVTLPSFAFCILLLWCCCRIAVQFTPLILASIGVGVVYFHRVDLPILHDEVPQPFILLP